MSDIFDQDLDLTLPEISPAEIRQWLQRRIKDGVDGIEKARRAWEGVRDGELPKESFNPKKFEDAKRFAAYFRTTYDLLRPIIGEAPAEPDVAMDEMFFSMMSDLYGFDVTKPRELTK